MNIESFVTGDGSQSLYHKQLDEPYHSRRGAVAESMHVFIKMGFDRVQKDNVRIFEMGFGTGLNFLLTAQRALDTGKKTEYHAIEKYPLDETLWQGLDYSAFVSAEVSGKFDFIHKVRWGSTVEVLPGVLLRKMKGDMQTTQAGEAYDLVYFDAFGPGVQPELWETPVFRKLFSMMNPGGVLVTYSAKGQVRRNMQEAGFVVERLPGPPGKREMLRAVKPNAK